MSHQVRIPRIEHLERRVRSLWEISVGVRSLQVGDESLSGIDAAVMDLFCDRVNDAASAFVVARLAAARFAADDKWKVAYIKATRKTVRALDAATFAAADLAPTLGAAQTRQIQRLIERTEGDAP